MEDIVVLEELDLAGVADEGRFFVVQVRSSRGCSKLRINKDRFGRGVDAGWCILPSGRVRLWAIKFDKRVFKDRRSVREWIKEHPRLVAG